MQLNIKTNEEIAINNNRARIVSIDPELPSLVTTISLIYLEGPRVGESIILQVTNQETL